MYGEKCSREGFCQHRIQGGFVDAHEEASMQGAGTPGELPYAREIARAWHQRGCKANAEGAGLEGRRDRGHAGPMSTRHLQVQPAA